MELLFLKGSNSKAYSLSFLPRALDSTRLYVVAERPLKEGGFNRYTALLLLNEKILLTTSIATIIWLLLGVITVPHWFGSGSLVKNVCELV